MKFKKKPVVIEAMQLTRNFAVVVVEWVGKDNIRLYNLGEFKEDACYVEIETLEGVMTAREGDWIIKGVNGEFYPCKPEIAEGVSPFAALPTVCGTDKYSLDYMNMTADDWEVKQESMKFEFECVWRVSSDFIIYPSNGGNHKIGELKRMEKSGKRFRVTCVEVVEE